MYSPDQMRAYAQAALAQPSANGEPVYLASDGTFYPIPRKRQPLTDAQINQITAEHWARGPGALYAAYRAYARAIEAAHGIVPAPTTDTKEQR
jgi:hypothetical protein